MSRSCCDCKKHARVRVMLQLVDELESQGENGSTLSNLVKNMLRKCEGSPQTMMLRIMDALLTAEKLELVERICNNNDMPKPPTQVKRKLSVSNAACSGGRNPKRKRTTPCTKKKKPQHRSEECSCTQTDFEER
uniref:Vacuolar protein sorting/targeting protein 10 n=1 Tax=Lygus hesperus TaxID=30085 RepID=A0A0A9ZD04_LYGHE